MKKWILKAIVQKTISYLPFSTRINYFFQKYVTKGVYLGDEYYFDRLGHAKAHLEAYRQYASQPIPKTSLELGTGWYPVVPISFFLVGIDKIYSVDISFLTSKDRIKTTLEKFIAVHQANTLAEYINVQPDRWAILLDTYKRIDNMSLEEILTTFHLEYKIEDARHLSLPDNSIDFINSNNTFEHIYPDILIPILKEFKRVLNTQQGVMSHAIDMSDHFAHFDKSITIYHFLQFSARQWSRIDNSVQPQNRLRIDDFRKIYKDLAIPITAETFRPGSIEDLKTVTLDAEFKAKPIEIVAISHCHFISSVAHKG